MHQDVEIDFQMRSEGAAMAAKLMVPMEAWVSFHHTWDNGIQDYGTWDISVFSAEVGIFSAQFSLLGVLAESLSEEDTADNREHLPQLRADLLRAVEMVDARIAELERSDC